MLVLKLAGSVILDSIMMGRISALGAMKVAENVKISLASVQNVKKTSMRI